MSIHATVCRSIDRPLNSRPEETGRVEARLGALAPALVGGLAVVVLGFADGGFSAPSWGWATLAVMGVTLAALVLGGGRRSGRLEYAFAGGLAALAVWALCSTLWSEDPAQSVLDAQRALLYTAVATALLLTGRRGALAPLLGGLLAAIVVVAVYALSLRLFPDSLTSGGVPLSTDPEAAFKLAQPLGYANALGALAAIGLALSLLLAARCGRAPAALAAAAAPLLATTLYLTFGRGAWLALGGGLLAAVALDPRRLRLVTSLLVLVPAPVLAVLLTSQLGALTSRPASVDDVADDGRVLAAALVVLALVAAASALAYRRGAAQFRPAPRTVAAYRTSLVVVAAGLLLAVIAAAGGPVDLATRAYHAFNAPPAPREGDVSRRVLTFSGSNRSEYWRVAWADVEDHPLLGSGAGTYQRRWLRHRPADLPVRDAHSLYLETLAELGPVGLLLLLGALAAPLAAAVRAREQPLVPAALAAYGCFLLHTGIDWDWEMPAVTIAGLCAGAALLFAASPRDVARRASGRLLPVAVGAACVLLPAIGILLAGNVALERSEAALGRADSTAAKREARRAERWAPWSPEPWRLLGEAQLTEGNLAAARASFRKGIAKDDGDWELWLDLALASEGAERRRALERAETLNPRAAEVDELRAEG